MTKGSDITQVNNKVSVQGKFSLLHFPLFSLTVTY